MTILSKANAIFVPSRCSSSCFLRWWHSRLWAAWIVRRNAPNGRSRLERRYSTPGYLQKLAVMPSPLVCLTANDADSAVRKITHKSPNMPPWSSPFEGSVQKKREFIQLIECYHLFLTYLTSLKGVSLDFKEYCTYRRNRKEILLKSNCKNPTCFCDQDMRQYLRSQPRGRDLREAGEVLRLKWREAILVTYDFNYDRKGVKHIYWWILAFSIPGR